ncbi:hypothetical protein [Chryseobacterium sp.]|uniref:hypothetical protein n=1 Tax=Chryseobacterium sp. TaxID=1871047 RepID=UPI0011CA14F8|nr:hypothetical protein [Chryseobacterium sp.]TXF77340.1 hypothetical protein FUA25_05250 [Chryseobacterium sp.]
MIGIFILIAAYRYYASLAEKFNKVKWHYGILGIAIYIGTQVIFLFSTGVYIGFTDPDSIDDSNYNSLSGVNLIGWALAIIVVYGIYKLLEKRFEKERIKLPSLEIEEIGKREV